MKDKDGNILIDGREVGEFKLNAYPMDTALLTVSDGLRLKDVIEHAADNGLRVELQLTPIFDRDGVDDV